MIYLILKNIAYLFSYLPRLITMQFGKIFGLTFFFLGIRKKVAMINLKIAFPKKNECERKLILIKSYIHYGIILSDFLRQINLDRKKLNEILIIDKKTKKNLSQNTGGCIMSAHLGNWEMILPSLGLNNIPMLTVIQKQSSISVNKFYKKLRTFQNITLIEKGDLLKEMYKALENNIYLGLASDQNAGKRGVQVDFFNKTSSIPKGTARFYNRTGCKVVIVYCILMKNGKYALRARNIMSEIKKDPSENNICSIFSKDLELFIKKYPEQYFWFHRRWKKNIYN